MNTRPIATADLADVLALNEESVHFLSPLSAGELGKLHRQSAVHRIVEDQGHVIAFVLAFEPGADYDSVNYQWFAARYERFLYIDRVVVSRRVRSKGAGSALYREVFAYADEHRIPIVACEFDVVPPNPDSERFHRRFGFVEVGQQSVAHGKKTVSLQVTRLTAGE
jgi:uncharacterized protein